MDPRYLHKNKTLQRIKIYDTHKQSCSALNSRENFRTTPGSMKSPPESRSLKTTGLHTLAVMAQLGMMCEAVGSGLNLGPCLELNHVSKSGTDLGVLCDCTSFRVRKAVFTPCDLQATPYRDSRSVGGSSIKASETALLSKQYITSVPDEVLLKICCPDLIPREADGLGRK